MSGESFGSWLRDYADSVGDDVAVAVPAAESAPWAYPDQWIFRARDESRICAPVSIMFESGGSIFLSIGRGTPVEIDPNSDEENLEALQDYLDAAVEGRLRERVWIRDGNLVRSKLWLDSDGHAYKHTYRDRLGLGGTPQNIDYEPYVSIET